MNTLPRVINRDRYFSAPSDVFVVGQESDPEVLAAITGMKRTDMSVTQGIGGTGIKLLRKELGDGSSMYVGKPTNNLHLHNLDIARGTIVSGLSVREKRFLAAWYEMRGLISQAVATPYSVINMYAEEGWAVIPLISNPDVTVDTSDALIDDPTINPETYDPHAFTSKENILFQARTFRASQ